MDRPTFGIDLVNSIDIETQTLQLGQLSVWHTGIIPSPLLSTSANHLVLTDGTLDDRYTDPRIGPHDELKVAYLMKEWIIQKWFLF